MNKIKLIIASMIGAIVLVFACVFGSANVNAAIVDESGSSTIIKYNVSKKNASWEAINATGSNVTITEENGYGINNPNSFKATNESGDSSKSRYEIKKSKWIYFPVPKDSSGSVTLDSLGNGNITTVSLYKTSVLTGDGKSITQDDKPNAITINFTSDDLYSSDSTNYYVGLYFSANYKCKIVSITLSSGEFVETKVTALQQEAVVDTVTYLRFVFIVSNDTSLTSTDFANKLTLILDENETTQQTKTCSPKAYDKLTLGSSTYTATVKGESYSFDNSINTNDIYVVYVVGFTTANYVGHNVKASLNVNSTEYPTSGYDFK